MPRSKAVPNTIVADKLTEAASTDTVLATKSDALNVAVQTLEQHVHVAASAEGESVRVGQLLRADAVTILGAASTQEQALEVIRSLFEKIGTDYITANKRPVGVDVKSPEYLAWSTGLKRVAHNPLRSVNKELEPATAHNVKLSMKGEATIEKLKVTPEKSALDKALDAIAKIKPDEIDEKGLAAARVWLALQSAGFTTLVIQR